MSLDPKLLEKLDHLRSKMMPLTLLGIIASAIGFFIDREQFMICYLVSFLFWMGLTIGAFPMISLHHLTSGNWGFPVRRILECMTQLIPLALFFFVPLLLMPETLYLWARPEAVAHDTLLKAKQIYLNMTGFTIRAVIYFAIWFVLGMLFRRWSADYDRNPAPTTSAHLQILGGVGLVLYGLTVSFASIDWAMSIEPHWYSTIYGVFFMIGQTLTSFAFCVLFVLSFSHVSPYKKIVTTDRSHDLGNLLFAMIMLWAYINISQFVIIWSGNLPEETPWYIKRTQGGWALVAIALTVFHFFLPFFLLLMRKIKQNPQVLSKVALAILAVRWVDLVWLIKPAFKTQLNLHWMDFSIIVAMGGIWFHFFYRALKKTNLTLHHDPIFHNQSHHHS